MSRLTLSGTAAPDPVWPDAPLGGLAEDVGHLLESLAERRTGERIAERLLTALALGQYWPGQRLPSERRLASLLQVSRSSARHGIGLLKEQGYVEIRRGRNGGAFVTDRPVYAEAAVRRTLLSGWTRLAALLDFRSTVEAQIAFVAAERRTKSEATSIRRLADDYLASGISREPSQRADQALHDAIAAATHNPFWRKLSLELRYEVNQGLGTEPFSPKLRQRGEEQHPVLAEAVAKGDAERAARLAASHFELNSVAIRELLASVSRQRIPRPAREAQCR
jgi:GntR family transcriptional regulator, transcriptional repressor for pyruvate dehydrogenase complex